MTTASGRGQPKAPSVVRAASIRTGVTKALHAYKRRQARPKRPAASRRGRAQSAKRHEVGDLSLLKEDAQGNLIGLLEETEDGDGQRANEHCEVIVGKHTVEEANTFLFKSRGPGLPATNISGLAAPSRSLWGSTYSGLPSIVIPSASQARSTPAPTRNQIPSPLPGRGKKPRPGLPKDTHIRPAQPASAAPAAAGKRQRPRPWSKTTSEDPQGRKSLDARGSRASSAEESSHLPHKRAAWQRKSQGKNASFVMRGSSRKFSSPVHQTSSSFSRVDVQLTRMHHSTLAEEIQRLEQENADFAGTLVLLEETSRKRNEHLDNTSFVLEREAEQIDRSDTDITELETQAGEVAAKLKHILVEHDATRFRHRQLQRMVLRARDVRNLAKRKTEGLQTLLASTSAPREMQELRVKLSQAQQELEALLSRKASAEASLKTSREEIKTKCAERARILSEVQQLRILQIDTALRRREIAMLAQGDVTKRQERRLKQASIINAKRKTVTESVLANMKCSVSRYEKTIRKIQKATGIWDVNTVVDRFFSQESKRTQLENDLLEAMERRKELEQRLAQSTAQLLHAREYGVEASGQDVADLGVLEGQVTESSGRLRHQKETFQAAYRLIVTLVEGTRTLARGLSVNVPSELQCMPDGEIFDASASTTHYGKLVKMMLGDLLSRLVYILNHAPGSRVAAEEVVPEASTRTRLRRKLSNVSHVSTQAQQWMFEYASVASPASPASPGHASRAMLRIASPTEIMTLQQVERSLNSYLRAGADKAALHPVRGSSVNNANGVRNGNAASKASGPGQTEEELRVRNIRVQSRRDSCASSVESVPGRSRGGANSSPSSREHSRKHTLNKMLKSMVEGRSKATEARPLEGGVGMATDSFGSKADVDKSISARSSADKSVYESEADTEDGAENTDVDADEDELAASKTCFAFLQDKSVAANDDLARATTRSMRRRQRGGDSATSQKEFNEALEHNRVLFNLLGRRRTEFGQPEAISASDLYKEVLRKDIKVPCFSREDIKMLSNHLLKQDTQSQTLAGSKSFSRDFNRKQSTFTRLRSGTSSKFSLLPQAYTERHSDRPTPMALPNNADVLSFQL